MKSLTKLSLLLSAALILAGCGKSARVEKDLGPADTITETAHSIAKNDPGAGWVMLPKSYRADINGMAHMIGEKMPADIWDKTFTLVGRLGKVLQTKKEYLTKMDSPPEGVSKEEMGDALDKIGDILIKVSESEIATVAKLKSVDLGNVADTTLTDIMKSFNSPEMKKVFLKISGVKEDNYIDSLGKVKAEVVSESGSSAKVKVTDPKGKVEEVELTKVEGKWIPKEMAADFKDEMKKAKEQLAKGLDSIPQNKQNVVMMLTMAEGVISNLEKANSKEDIAKSMEALPMNPLAMIMGGALSKSRNKAREARSKMNLKHIGIAAATVFADGTVKEFDGTWAQLKGLENAEFDLNDYHMLFYKGQVFEGADNIPVAAEKTNEVGDGINVVFQDVHVEKIMGKFNTLEDIKNALKAKGFKVK